MLWDLRHYRDISDYRRVYHVCMEQDPIRRLSKNFVLGFAAGVLGLAINAVFIDVFGASKVAFVLWLLTGVVIGALTTYHRVPLKFSTS